MNMCELPMPGGLRLGIDMARTAPLVRANLSLGTVKSTNSSWHQRTDFRNFLCSDHRFLGLLILTHIDAFVYVK